jgi:IS605 OrfB family transposase
VPAPGQTPSPGEMPVSVSPYVICLDGAGRAELEAVSRRATAPFRLVLRARIVLLAAAGTPNSAIAERLGTCEDTARKWRRRYCEQGFEGLADAPRPGRLRVFTLDGRVLRLPVARGGAPLVVRLDRDVPYPAEQVRAVTLGFDVGRLYLDVTAEVPVATYPQGTGPDPGRVAGVDLGIIHPYAVAGPGGAQLLVSGRAIRAECRQHLRDRKGRTRAAARRAPKPGQHGSRRWRQHKRRQRQVEARHLRRVRQAQHEAAKTVVSWAVEQRAGTLAVGDPRGVLNLKAGRRHNKRLRDWRVGHLIRVLRDKAEAAGITVKLVDERGTSSTCPNCSRRVPKPAGRNFRCPHCGHEGHRDLVAAANIAARNGGGTTIPAATDGAGITHRRAGAHLPGVHPARRDPRRRPPSRPPVQGLLAGTGPPRAAPAARGVARPTARSPQAAG